MNKTSVGGLGPTAGAQAGWGTMSYWPAGTVAEMASCVRQLPVPAWAQTGGAGREGSELGGWAEEDHQ